MRKATLGVIAIMIVAGCLSAAANTESAESLESTAADRQEDRTENGELVALWGVEPPRHIEEERVTVDIYLDDETFDGQTAGWAYGYIGDDKAGIVVVGDTIGVLGEAWYTFEGNESQEANAEVQPIEDWDVDSEDVADILADDDRWPEMSASWATSWQLMQHEDGPIWKVHATNVSLDGAGTSVHAAVSASNGTILHLSKSELDGFEPGFDDDDAPSSESREGGCAASETAGTVTPIDDVSTDIEIGDDGTLQLDVTTSGAGPLDLALLEDGEEEVWTDSMLVTGPSGVTATIDDLDDGDYVIEATTDAGAIDVTISAQAQWGEGRCQTSTSSTSGPTSGPTFPIDARPASAYRIMDPAMGLSSLSGGAFQR